jgi:trimeric autotransporter adhesin
MANSSVLTQFVDGAAQTLNIGLGTNQNLQNVVSNVNLFQEWHSGTRITWQSSNVFIISNTGSVTRPHGADANVSLTATISKESVSTTKVFNLIVKQI